MSSEFELSIAREVLSALENDQLDLPTLPDIAIKIRTLLDDPNVSADRLVNLLAADPVISTHIIKVANSARYSGYPTVENLRDAISRMGYQMLRNLVLNITLTKLFQSNSPLVNQRLNQLWNHSRDVAACCYVIALHQRHLKPEQAMLAGLVHDIGSLPLYLYADAHHPRLEYNQFEKLIRQFNTLIGAKLLRNWHFSEELIDAVEGHENLQRTSVDNISNYADVVTVANLQMQGNAKFVAWENVIAASRLGYSNADCQNFLEKHAAQFEIVLAMLGADVTPRAKIAHQTMPLGETKTEELSEQQTNKQKTGFWVKLRRWMSH